MTQLKEVFEAQENRSRKAKNLRLDLASRHFEKLKEFNYDIDWVSNYQCRINGSLDIYPISRKYHDLVGQKRGSYKNLNNFIYEYFN